MGGKPLIQTLKVFQFQLPPNIHPIEVCFFEVCVQRRREINGNWPSSSLKLWSDHAFFRIFGVLVQPWAPVKRLPGSMLWDYLTRCQEASWLLFVCAVWRATFLLRWSTCPQLPKYQQPLALLEVRFKQMFLPSALWLAAVVIGNGHSLWWRPCHRTRLQGMWWATLINPCFSH